MKISVLICTRNRPQDIVWCLPAVLSNEYSDFEVVLVDQSDGQETAEFVETLLPKHPNFHYVPTETRGHDLALNLGVSKCQGEIIACTDDDCEPEAGWVAHLAKLYGDDPSVEMIFGQVHKPSDLPEEDLIVPSLYFAKQRQLKRGDIFGMGANMSFRKSLFERIGGFDDLLGPGAPLACSGDFDFLYRAQRLGAKAIAEPSLVMVHRAHRSRDQWGRVMYLYGLGDAAFYLKHARCGDFWALRSFAGKLLHATARRVIGPLIGRGKSQDKYLSGLLDGITKSRHYRVDRADRRYIAASSQAVA